MSQNLRTHTGRVIDIHDVSSDIRKIFVEIENKQRLSFNAGQYVHLSAEDHEARAFSIASSPHENLLEFHIKNSGYGISAHMVENIKTGSTIQLKGPMGTSYLRSTDHPILALAGGLGITPLKSIIDSCLHHRADQPISLYWGARNSQQLYLDNYFRDLAKRHSRFSYIPVLSDEKDNPRYRSGFTVEAVFEDFETLSGMHIYMAGPAGMMEATLPALLEKGAEKDAIFSDSFTI